VVKLLPCDHEVTSSSHGNSLLQKCRERLRTKDQSGRDPSPDPAQAGATCTGARRTFNNRLQVAYVVASGKKVRNVAYVVS
jgi:hypothetical protein